MEVDLGGMLIGEAERDALVGYVFGILDEDTLWGGHHLISLVTGLFKTKTSRYSDLTCSFAYHSTFQDSLLLLH